VGREVGNSVEKGCSMSKKSGSVGRMQEWSGFGGGKERTARHRNDLIRNERLNGKGEKGP